MDHSERSSDCETGPKRESAARRWAWDGLDALLIVAVLAVYGQTLGFDLLAWDDEMLVANNPYLYPPSLGSVKAFWIDGYAGIYMPITYSAWMLVAPFAKAFTPVDAGDEASPFAPWVFHLLNIGLFVVIVLSLRRLIARMTGRPISAALGALFFAVHPVQVESVAWVSEAKGLWAFLLGLWAIDRYLIASKSDDPADRWNAQTAATGYYLLALLAKPWAVAVPIMAVVCDRGFGAGRLRRMAPMLALWVLMAGGLVAMTQFVQGSFIRVDLPWIDRPAVALTALLHYAQTLFLPIDLSPDSGLPIDAVRSQQSLAWSITAWVATAIFAGLFVIWCRTKHRGLGILFLALAALAPVLGLMPFAYQSISITADRYMLPAMFAVTVGLAHAAASARMGRWITPALLILSLGLGAASFAQARYWRTNESLITRALEVYPDSVPFLTNRGMLRLRQGDLEGAEADCRRAIELSPRFTQPYYNLAAVQIRRDEIEPAVQSLKRVFEFEPADRYATGMIMKIYALDRQYEQAIRYAERLREQTPGDPAVTGQHGRYLILAGKEREGLDLLEQATGRAFEPPTDALAIAQVYEQQGEFAEAVRRYEALSGRVPSLTTARRRWAWILATCPDDSVRTPTRAEELALELTRGGRGGTPDDLDILAAAQAALGKFKEAIQTAKRARRRAGDIGEHALAIEIDRRIERYEAGQPYQSPAPGRGLVP